MEIWWEQQWGYWKEIEWESAMESRLVRLKGSGMGLGKEIGKVLEMGKQLASGLGIGSVLQKWEIWWENWWVLVWEIWLGLRLEMQ